MVPPPQQETLGPDEPILQEDDPEADESSMTYTLQEPSMSVSHSVSAPASPSLLYPRPPPHDTSSQRPQSVSPASLGALQPSHTLQPSMPQSDASVFPRSADQEMVSVSPAESPSAGDKLLMEAAAAADIPTDAAVDH